MSVIRYKTITLANNRAISYVDESDYDMLMEYKWRVSYNRSDDTCYATTTIYDKETKSKHDVKMHRMIMGLTDSKIVVDHVNGNGLDNRRYVNLRAVTSNENGRNKHTVRFNGLTYEIVIFGLVVETMDTRNDALKIWHQKMFQRFGKFYKNDFRNLREVV